MKKRNPNFIYLDTDPGRRFSWKTCPTCEQEILMRADKTYCSISCGVSGERGGQWKGDDAGYQALHERVWKRRGRAKDQFCACGASGAEWANLTGNYADTSDYQVMCRSCHGAFDAQRRRADRAS